MSVQANARPIIIKKKKVSGGDGHHGGAWKVAYADFVTAMMAFFMLMWLLNATTEKQRKGIADYFSPTIPINRVSGGGDGSFGGDSVFSEVTLPQNGTGASSQRPTEARQARGESGADDSGEIADEQDEVFESLEARLLGKGGETKVLDNDLQHIITRVTDEGLVVELFAREDTPLFEEGTDIPTQLLRNLSQLVTEAARTVKNDIAVEGHVPAQPIVVAERSTWRMSVARADAVRQLLKQTGVETDRVARVTGHADREPAVKNPMAMRNNRIEIIFLRD
ncbi:flagellar motor protein MotB [Tateyamaria sp. ANG-S1]|uniref:flagellar motor protein MotB n=1 Tax=Tateyamaria sp. ANG-S1 TaxID=1577905 RepID=UPI00057ED032|nr:flagellar motor protein MotB [Tateyamaria sp. ANG-S1]KIC49616.1 chemotaxis protein MotB [Tateyamaria sp. ANG-S1]